jgi:hypothetical protein
MREALTTSFTSKNEGDNKKLAPQLTIGSQFFIAHLPILIRCKPKAQSERCAGAPYCAIGNEVPTGA